MNFELEYPQPESNATDSSPNTAQPIPDHVDHEIVDHPRQPNRSASGNLDVLSATDFKKIPPPVFIIDGVLPSGVTILFAKPGAGKSFFALAIGTAVARGLPLFEQHETKKPGGVPFVLPEGVPSWAERLRAHDDHFDFDDSPDMHFVRGEVNLDKKPGWAQLLGVIETINTGHGSEVALVVIDTLAAATPGANENSVEEIGLVMHRLQSLAGRGIAVLVCHHAGKSGDFRGHTSISGSCDALLRLVEDKPTGIRELRAEKLRDAGSINSCPFEIHVTAHGAVAVKTSTKSTWGLFEEHCEEHPGLLDALLAHGLAVPGSPPSNHTDPSFAEGVSARAVQSTWNRDSKPDDRAVRARRRRAVIATFKKLHRAGVLRIVEGNLGKPEAAALNAVVVQIDTASVTDHPPLEEGGDRDSK